MLTLVAAAATSDAARGETPVCRVVRQLEPREAFADQQVLHRLRIEARPEVRSIAWLVPPAFPGLRSERLTGRPDAGQATHAGVGYRAREEHTALFPERRGSLELPEASLRCTAALHVLDVRVPPSTLRVRALPDAGRPPGFAGLVGRVDLRRRVEPDTGTVGRSLRVTVRMRGEANLWDATDPYASETAFEGAEVFRLAPEQDLVRGERLVVGRLFAYDVVPARSGPLTLPGLQVSWFDPARGTYVVAALPEQRVQVADAPPPAAAGSPPARAPDGRRGKAPSPAPAAGRVAGWIALFAAGTLLGGLGLRLAARRRRGAHGYRRALDAAAEDPAALGRALRTALAHHVPGARARTPEELLAAETLSPAARAATELLASLERARFDPESEAPDRGAVERSIEALRRSHPA